MRVRSTVFFFALTACGSSDPMNDHLQQDDFGESQITGEAGDNNQAQAETIQISGNVFDVDGLVVSEAYVSVIEESSEMPLITMTTDGDGEFQLDLPAIEGNYMIVAAFDDDGLLLIDNEQFSVSSGTENLDFALKLSMAPTGDSGYGDTGGGAPPPSECGYNYSNTYWYGWCWITHTFYVHATENCWPYESKWLPVGSC